MSAAEGPTRVLRVITRLNVGGPAQQALMLTRRLAPEFATTLAAGAVADNEGELSDPEVAVRRVPLRRAVDPRADAQALWAVRSLLIETGAALVHSHMAKAGAVARAAAFSLPSPPRTVHTFHGHVLDGYFSPLAQRAFVEVERRLARRTDALVAVSPQVRDDLLALGIGSPDRFHVVRVGLDLARFLAVDQPTGSFRRSLGLGPEVPLVGVVGRLVPIKDLGTILAAMALLPGAHLAVVGDGECRAGLVDRASRLGIGERVHFTGWCTDVAEVLADLDVVALSSRNEGTPVSLIEAGAAARAVVATRVGGVSAVVVDGVTGHMVDPGRPEEMAALLRRLVGDPAERRRMGEAARDHVRKTFGHERLVGEVRMLYRVLVGHGEAGQRSSGETLDGPTTVT